MSFDFQTVQETAHLGVAATSLGLMGVERPNMSRHMSPRNALMEAAAKNRFGPNTHPVSPHLPNRLQTGGKI